MRWTSFSTTHRRSPTTTGGVALQASFTSHCSATWAGTEAENTGHHHILVDRAPLGEGEDGADEFDANLPADEHHRHFGKGQTETVLELSPGKHTLQLVLGDKDHIPHDKPVVSPQITITVE